jgi:ribokinase
LNQDHIDTRFVLTDEKAPTGVALIAVENSGENRIIIVVGANGQVSPADVDNAATTIAEADALLLQLEVPLPTVIRAAEVARKNGVRVILNPAPAQPLPHGLLAHIDYLIPNESEAALLTNTDASQPEQAAQALRTIGVGNVIVTLGAQGALLVAGAGSTIVPGFSVTAVDTTAAGDSFVGAFVVALADGAPPAEAIRRANAAGALATTVLGAQPSIPTRAAVSDFLAQH